MRQDQNFARKVILIILFCLILTQLFSVISLAEEIDNSDSSHTEVTQAPDSVKEAGEEATQTTELEDDQTFRLEDVQYFPFESITGFSFESYSEKPLNEIYADYKDKVAAIYSSKITAGGNNDYSMISNGFFVSADGYFLTSYRHIDDVFDLSTNNIKSDVSLKILTNFSLELMNLSLVKIDTEADLVLFKADLSILEGQIVPYVTFEDNISYGVGQALIGIGFPDYLSSAGSIYPGFLMEVGIFEVDEQNFRMRKLKSSAIIPNTASGCLIVNSLGQAVGISSTDPNRSLNDRYSLIFPGDMVKMQLDSYFSDEETPINAKLGLKFMADLDYEKLMITFNLPKGLYITKVLANGQAYVNNIRRGDIILSLNGQAVETVNDYLNVLEQNEPGNPVTVEVFRPSVNQTLSKTLYFD